MEILTRGKLKNKITGTEHGYKLIRLDENWLDMLIELQAAVMGDMEKKELYAGLNEEELINVLGINGITLGTLVDDRLVGFYSILFPGRCEYNLGNDTGVPKDFLVKVAHLEGAGVHPDFRGNSLQKVMARVCLDEALKKGKTRYVCATVSQYNYPSIDHVFALKLCITDIKMKYNGMLRYICLRDLESNCRIERDSIVKVNGVDLKRQSELLKKGYYGFEQIRFKEKNQIRFGRFVW